MQFDEEYYNSEEFLSTLEQYEASVNEGDVPFMDADDFVDIADYYNMLGDTDSAQEAVKHALDIYPSATLPNVFMARQALLENDFHAARDFCERIESKDDPDYHYLVAEIMIAEGHVDEADRYLRHYGLSVEPEEHEDFIKDCANLFIDYGISEKAYEWMMRSKGDSSDDFKELMARTLCGLGKYKDSERIFNELLDRNPYSKQYWNALSSVQFMNEQYNDAVTSSEYAIAIDPDDPEGLLSKANGLLRLGNFEEALEYYRRYSRQVPDDEFGLLQQGVCLVGLCQQKEAIELLLKAAEMTATDSVFLPQIYQELAFCYSSMGDVEKATEMIDRTQELPCNHIGMLVIRGHILLECGKVNEAEETFKQAMSLSDNSPAVLLRIIVSLYDNRYVEACYQMFKKFFNIINSYAPDFSEGYAYMALCCHDLGKTDEFMRYLKKAAEVNPYETRLVLSYLFPQGMEPKDYYEYMQEQLKL